MRRPLILAACLVAVLAAIPALLGSFYVNLASYIGIYALVALGIVVLTGAGGMISLGQAAFVGVGAYTTSILTTSLGLSPWVSLPAAMLLSGAVAIVLGLISLRLSGHYLAVITIGWGMTIFLLFSNVEALGGHYGFSDIPAISLFGYSLAAGIPYFYLIWAVVLLATLGTSNLLRSRQGRAIRALRGGDALVKSLGIDPFAIRLKVFVTSAMISGLAGWLFAHLQRYVGPDPFDLNEGITFLLMAIVGGAGSVWGAILGATLITSLGVALQSILPRLLESILPFLATRAGNFEIVAYGCLFILLLQRAPGGVMGLLARTLERNVSPKLIRTDTGGSLDRKSMPETGREILRVEDLTRRFGGLLAVDGVDLELRAGEILALIGPNGAGKTTMFGMVSGLLRPSNGKIVFRGVELSGSSTKEFVRLGMARTFQHVKLRPRMTALENVMLGAHSRGHAGFLRGIFRLDTREEKVIAAEALNQLVRVGLEDRAGQLAGNLPLGQQRLLEVARALAADPLLLMLDEPAAGLRQQEKNELAATLIGLKQAGVTILLVEHDMTFVMGLADRVVVLDYGRKLMEGRPEDVRASAVVQEAYLGVAS